MIPAYSPQARGRCERSFGTWQNACHRNCGWRDLGFGRANQFLRQNYLAEFNRMFAGPSGKRNGVLPERAQRSGPGVLDPDRTT